MRYYDLYESPHGRMLLVANGEGLSGVYFDGQKYLPRVDPEWRRDARHAPLRQAKRELAEYFGGERKRFETALVPEGTPFQRSVWKVISSVGFGETITYSELARRAGFSGSARAARQLEASGVEVLLHLPMEPRGFPSVRPGPGVLLRAQSDEELGSILESDLETVPGAVGVNNHMGSAATADPRVMRAIMRVLARRGLFFVDSRTTETTVAEAEARAAGVPAVSRRVFLDDVLTGEAVEKSLAELASRARRDGFAVGIGHPHAATLTVLERELPKLERDGVRLVKVSELVN